MDILDDDLGAPLAEAELEGLRACRGPLVVRVHATPGDHAPSACLRVLLGRADAVIVSTRSHLVRLGSAGLLVADRTNLIAPAAPILRGDAAPSAGAGALVLGAQLPEALELAFGELSLDHSLLGPETQDAGAARRLGAVAGRHALLVVTSTAHAEDGVLAAVCGQLGRALVAPGGVDLAWQPHCFPVGSSPSVQDWVEALSAGLGASLAASNIEHTASDQLDRLARVLSRATRRKDCPQASAA